MLTPRCRGDREIGCVVHDPYGRDAMRVPPIAGELVPNCDGDEVHGRLPVWLSLWLHADAGTRDVVVPDSLGRQESEAFRADSRTVGTHRLFLLLTSPDSNPAKQLVSALKSVISNNGLKTV
jgi:hypothetical protein